MDNLKALKENVDTALPLNGGVGSVKVENHNALEKEIIDKVGKMTGFPFTSKRSPVGGVIPSGCFFWNGSAMNQTTNFDIYISKFTLDGNYFNRITNLISEGSLLHFKDAVGRSTLFEVQQVDEDFDVLNNPYIILSVKGFAENIDYSYQPQEEETCMLEFLSSSDGETTQFKDINYQDIKGTGNLPFHFMNATTFGAYGDSITFGSNASPESNSYVNKLSTLYSKQLNNRAVSATTIGVAIKAHFANVQPNSTELSILMLGFNDMRLGGVNPKTLNKILNGYRSIIANQFLSSFIGAGAASSKITKSGTWNIYNGLSSGAKTDIGSYSSIINNYIEYTFTDNNVVVGLMASDGVVENYANFDVSIDGVNMGSFSEKDQTDGLNGDTKTAMCLVFKNLEEGTHVIRLTNTTNLPLIVDYFGSIKQAKFCYPILIMNPPKMNAAGYAGGISSDYTTEYLSDKIEELVNLEFNEYPIVIGKTNDYYDITTGLDTDNIHPNNTGHTQIYAAAYNAMLPLLLSAKVVISGVANRLAYFESVDSVKNTNIETDQNSIKFPNGGSTVFKSSQPNANSKVTNDGSANFPNVTLYPETGTDIGMALNVMPRGAGYSVEAKSQIVLWGTDFKADSANYEYVAFRANNNCFTLATGADGTGIKKPLVLAAKYGDGVSNPDQLVCMISGNVGVNTRTDNGVDKLQVNGSVLASQYKLKTLNSAPLSATDTGVLGEVRITSDYIYVCIAANTWVRNPLTTW